MNILKLIINFFKSKFEIKPTGRVFEMPGEYWGVQIFFYDFERRLIYGYTDKKILTIGDELRAKMKSGMIARFLITDMEYCEDPPDMFFATVKDVGFLDK
jgi:hypothetical protein